MKYPACNLKLLSASALLSIIACMCFAAEGAGDIPKPRQAKKVYKVVVDNGLGDVKEVYITPKKRTSPVNPNALAELKESGKFSNVKEDSLPKDAKTERKDTENISNASEADSIIQISPDEMQNNPAAGNRFYRNNTTDSDGNVIANAVIQRFTRRENNLSGQNYQGEDWNGSEMSAQYKDKTASNLIGVTNWESRFSNWNKEQNDSIEVRRMLTNAEREKIRLDRKNYEFKNEPISTWSGNRADEKNWDERISQDLHEKFLATKVINLKERFDMQNTGLRNFSMEDINRYQYRRNRSSEPGLTKAAVGTGDALKPTQ